MEQKTCRIEREEKSGLTLFNQRGHIGSQPNTWLCSKHFQDDNFTMKFLDLTGLNLQQRLQKHEVVICVLPTVHTRAVQYVEE